MAFSGLICFLSVFWFSPPASASSLADCITLSNPRSSATSTEITLTADVTSICSSSVANYQTPVYEMLGEDSLLNMASCSGPMYQTAPSSIGEMGLGQIRCTLRIGGSSGSTRTGATSTTVKVFFAWDNSTKTISISHIPIPPLSNSSGGMSGSPGTSIPVSPSCTKAPLVPTLSISWNSAIQGPTFDAVAPSTGDSPTQILWNYTLYDASLAKWDAWPKWTPLSDPGLGAKFSYTAPLTSGKTRIAFAIYSVNACGASAQARERTDQTGVPLVGRQQLKISVMQDLLTFDLATNQKVIDVWSFASALSPSSVFAVVAAESQTPSICTVEISRIIHMVSVGTCELLLKAKGTDNVVDAEPMDFKFDYAAEVTAVDNVKVKLLKRTVTCKRGTLIKRVTAAKPTCPKGYKEK